MTRYFLDTGVLVGLTFLHDLWHDEAERLFETDNGLYTSPAVVYEYCNSGDSSRLEDTDIDWETEAGLFGEKLSRIRVAQMNLDLRLQRYDDDEIDLDTLTDAFIEEAEIEDRVYPSRLIYEYIRPNIREFLEEEIGDRELTRALGREVIDALCDTIQDEAREARKQIHDRITEVSSAEPDAEDRGQLEFVDGYVDKVVLCDAERLKDRNVLEKVITSDKSHMYSNRDRIEAVLGIRVLYIKDEFSSHNLPSED